MLKSRSLRSIAIGIATLVVAGTASFVGASTASATQIGTLSATPATGTDTSSINLNTSGACPSTATNLVVDLAGPGIPAGFVAVGNSPTSIYNGNSSGGYSVPLTQTMATYAQQAGTTLQAGTYTFTLTCRTKFVATSLGDFVGSIYFTSPTAYQSNQPTTTTLSVSPASPVQYPATTTLTATEAPAAAGSVQFENNGAALGAPVAVNSAGTATSTATLPAGNDSLTAVFTPTNTTAFAPSTSAAVPYTVNAIPTSTTLATYPFSSVKQGKPVVIGAAEQPGVAGSVQFIDNGAALGAPVPVTVISSNGCSIGVAAYTTSSLAVGTHALTAVFTPTNSNYGTSTSEVWTITVTQ